MFTIRQLFPKERKDTPFFTVRQLFPKNLNPVQERASYIASRCSEGVSYQAAIREYDTRQRARRHA